MPCVFFMIMLSGNLETDGANGMHVGELSLLLNGVLPSISLSSGVHFQFFFFFLTPLRHLLPTFPLLGKPA